VLSAALTLKRYKFNWSNPTAHWSLNLEDKTQRSIMMQIIAINNYESEFSKNHSGRGDTSQQVCGCADLEAALDIPFFSSAACIMIAVLSWHLPFYMPVGADGMCAPSALTG
jgi:hypothetical protein